MIRKLMRMVLYRKRNLFERFPQKKRQQIKISLTYKQFQMNSNVYVNDKGMKKAPTIKWDFANPSKN